MDANNEFKNELIDCANKYLTVEYADQEKLEITRNDLLHCLQTYNCRELVSAAQDNTLLANAFVVASARNHVDVLEAFLKNGMNVDVKDKDEWTALMNAQREESVRFLLDHNANVNVYGAEGFTPLMLAIFIGNIKIVEMLLEMSPDVNIQNNDGKTALMLASTQGRKSFVQLLLNRGAETDLKDEGRKTALDLARRDEIKELLQSHVNTSYVLK